MDHSNFLEVCRKDVILHGGPPLPPGAGAVEGTPGTGAGEGTSAAAVEEDFNDFYREFCQEDESGDSDPDFVDSDYEAAAGDDDLFRDNVDIEVNDNNEPVVVEDLEDDDALQDEDLNLG